MSANPDPERIIVFFEFADAWESWLEENGATSEAVWLKFAKKGSGIVSISYAEALDVALCYGWIDGQKASFDEWLYLLRFSRRGRKSKWSKINCEKATELHKQGRMRPAGLKEMESAKGDGRWENSYEPQSRMAVPDDFRARLDEAPRGPRVL